MNKNEKILLTGGSGIIGGSYVRHHCNNLHLLSPTKGELDIRDREIVLSYFATNRPNAIVNFAAIRDVEIAEAERGNYDGQTWQTNVNGTRNIQEACSRYQCYLIHISSDMVFPGHPDYPGPYPEDANTESEINNLSWYGITKRTAEKHVDINNAAIIRIGNVTESAYPKKLDYVGKILFLFQQGGLYPLFSDQQLTLTHIPTLFQVIDRLLEEKLHGIYHVASTDTLTPFELGKYIIESVYQEGNLVNPISIDDFLKQKPFRYPKLGGLLTLITQRKLQINFASWKEYVSDLIRQSTHAK